MGQEQKGINFNSCPAIYWSDATKVSYLQRRIIVHSILYYESNKSVISDRQFDDLCHQLVQMQSEVDFAEFRKSTYYYAMHDFDGSTGFDIPSRLTKYDHEYLTNIASHVYEQWKDSTTMRRRKRRRRALNANTKGLK